MTNQPKDVEELVEALLEETDIVVERDAIRFRNEATYLITTHTDKRVRETIDKILDIKGVGDMPPHEISYSQDSSKAYRSGRQDAVADYRNRIKALTDQPKEL